MLGKTPLGRFGKPVEVADLALCLASSASDPVCGETILIDGGFGTLQPLRPSERLKERCSVYRRLKQRAENGRLPA